MRYPAQTAIYSNAPTREAIAHWTKTLFAYVTRSDKRVTKCQLARAELLTPADSVIKELSFDIHFKTVHNAKVKL